MGDIGPRYAAILLGISNSFGQIAGLICPILTELITKDYVTVAEVKKKWEQVFLISAAIHTFDVVFYVIFASGKTQDWAKPSTEDESRISSPEEDEVVDTGHDTSNYGTVRNITSIKP